ncbi:MAG TPA: ubiquitin-activating E1 FCCH domain-containing protein [Rhodopila sp.]
MSGSTTTVPAVVVTAAGAQPQDPTAIRDQLVQMVANERPDFTANLPLSLIEDVTSTCTLALVELDAARVETVNSLTPNGSNPWLTTQLGQVYGVPQGLGSNGSVYAVFTGPPGFPIAQGFTISDGTRQYVVQDGGIIGSATGGGSTGESAPLFTISTTPGIFAIPANTVTQLVTSVPSPVALSVTNPTTGTPATAVQTTEDYQSQVLAAGLSPGQGMPSRLRKELANVTGVQPRLISIQAATGGGWKVICGGGDPYQIANAIFRAMLDITGLKGSVMEAASITQANPGVVTTTLRHGFSSGQVIQINGIVGMTELNGESLTITVISPTSFSIGVDTSGYTAYAGSGVVTPNLRNITASIADYPDSYNIIFVNPPQQTVAINLTWNTSLPNFVSQSAVAQLGTPALINYVNSLPVGQPMNLFELQAAFQQAIASVIPTQFLTRMVFAVQIDGATISPETGTGTIAGDPESYFETGTANIVMAQG